MKGAATQAIENMNLMCGWPRMAGLEHLARSA
jgi:N-acetyl-gamma-glutamylphosphate reductase